LDTLVATFSPLRTADSVAPWSGWRLHTRCANQ